jgi:hypothetical protein
LNFLKVGLMEFHGITWKIQWNSMEISAIDGM